MTALLALLALQPPVAAEPPPRRFHDAIEVTEVVVRAAVTDRTGRPVLGLGPDDFLILEEGSEVEVLSAEYVPLGRVTGAELAVARPGLPPAVAAPEPRYFILLFHDLRRTDRETLGVASHQMRAGRDARKWVREGLGDADWVAVAGYDYRLKLHQDFTDDSGAIERAIARATGREPEEKLPPAAGAPSLFAGLPPFTERRNRSARLRGALELLAEAVEPIDGSKNLLLFSVGIGLQGHERGILGPFDEPTLIERLNDSELAVHCLDTTPPEVEHALAGSLAVLAEATGGEYYGHVDRFQKPLRRIEARLRGVYLLTYHSPLRGGGYRRLEVSTRAPGLEVTARRGFLTR